ncbi:uncharacterized protein LTR77_010323 [Saxophila tyrrhenica]|uniref:Uncharacterized protein n=1 Tax=Saxophila tyrrhenica TaxID=1690608 RepID=A0AAV9NXG3_9PEZI|nr:hypothetical protein LTR77_010323 [Saxophila tyrrhenica]
MSVFTLSFFFLAFFSPISLASAVPDALPCPECEDEPPVPVQLEPCHECEHMHPPPPVYVTTTEDCDECEHNHPKTTPFVFTSTISTCRRQTTSHSFTPYTSGSSTFFLSSCKPTTLTKTQHRACETPSPSTITAPGSISTKTLFGNGTAVTITSYRNNTAPANTITVVSTKWQPGKTTTIAGSPTDYITVTKGRRTLASVTTAYITVAGSNSTCIGLTVTETITTKRTPTRSRAPPLPPNTDTVFSSGLSTVTITTQYPTCDRQITIIETATRVRRASTVTTTLPASSCSPETISITATAAGPTQYSTVPTTEYATLTSYASGSPPATIYLTRTRTTTETATITQNQISNRYSTVVQTATLPAETRTTTVRQPARTITRTEVATSEEVQTVTTTLPGSVATRTRTRTITATDSYFTTGTITTTLTVTRTLAASTITETTTSTRTAIRTRTQTTEVFSTATVTSERTLTATATAVSNVYSTATITRTQVRRITTTEEAPAGYCTPTTITNTATAVRTVTRTRTVTDAGAPPGYCETSTQTRTQTRTVTSRAACATAAPPTVANCRVPTGQFRIVIQNFGSAYLTSTSGGGSPNSDHESLTLTSAVGQALQFSAVSNGQTSFVITGGQTLYSDQDSDNAGNSPIFFDSLTSPAGYGGGGADAVQFCLRADNSFVVQSPSSGATSVMMCAGVVYLFSAENAATSGCTPITLVKA